MIEQRIYLTYHAASQVELNVQDDGYIWESFTLVPVNTSWVDVTIVASYDTRYTVIAEIEFYETGKTVFV